MKVVVLLLVVSRVIVCVG